MQYGTPHSQCQICQRTIQPHDRMTFQDGNLFHARCLEQCTRQCIEAERQAEAALHARRQAESP
jgi:hypothetical protein